MGVCYLVRKILFISIVFAIFLINLRMQKNCRLLENCEYIVAEIKKLEHTCTDDKDFKEKTLRLVNIATIKSTDKENSENKSD